MKKSTVVLISFAIAAVTIGMIFSAFMLSRFMLKIQRTTEKSITVKGVAENLSVENLLELTLQEKYFDIKEN